MTSIEAIKRIKVLLGIEKMEATATLIDGTPVHVDGEFAVGETLHVIQEDGSFVPAPEGTHTLEDGRQLIVDAAGVITEITEAAAEEVAAEEVEEKEEEMEEVVIEDVPAEAAPAVAEVVEAVIEAIAPLMTEVEELKAKLETLSGKFQKFSNEPAATPVRNNFKAENQSAKNEADARVEALINIRKGK